MHLFDPAACPFPVHSVCICRGQECLQEEYRPPFTPDGPHRMFSVTKSYVSLAVGALIAQGRLDLSAPIVSYFPDLLPDDPHPWLLEMTLEDLLTMRTCHKSTTYKLDARVHWVRSFFITPPDHRPGQIFRYDTSSAHTLAALVTRLTGQTVLGFLRTIFLDDIGFSADARILEDPFGCEMGGSGLVCRPSDLVRTGQVLMCLYKKQDPSPLLCRGDGKKARGLLAADPAFRDRYGAYVRRAMSLLVPTLHDGKTPGECAGYGYQFWQNGDGGVMMYGMGGQLVVFYPDQDLLAVTTADSQAVGGGFQYILDEIRRVRESLPAAPSADLPAAGPLPQTVSSSLFGRYRLLPNPAGFTALTLSAEALVLEQAAADGQTGDASAPGMTYRFPLGTDTPAQGREPLYGQPLFIRAVPQPDGSLFVDAQILGDYVGSLRMLLHGDGRRITLFIRRIEETVFPGFDGFFEGISIS